MENHSSNKLILASKSPIRRLLLRNAGLEFETQAADIDERKITTLALKGSEDLAQICGILAAEKAQKISKLERKACVIGADQTLELDGVLINKPENLDHAREQLLSFRGKTHILRSAVCLIKEDKTVLSYSDSAYLTMRNFSHSELDAVLQREGDMVLSAVGAYRLEGPALQLFDNVVGDYFTVLGLPIFKLIAGLRQYAPHFLLGAQNNAS